MTIGAAAPPDADAADSPSAARRSAARALAAICAAQFVLQLDFSIVNVALPTVQRELRFSAAGLQWVVTGYALAYGALLLTGGRAGDLAGHRRTLVGGLLGFAAGSLGAGLAPSAAALVVSRFAQGASAALVAPAALALLTARFPEGPARARALGLFQGSTAAGGTTGIVAGGLLTQYLGWRAVFLVNPPIILVLSVLVLRSLPRDARSAGSAGPDLPGAALATASIGCLIYGLNRGQDYGFSTLPCIAALAAAAALAALFIAAEARAEAPMVPAGIFADRQRRAALLAMFLSGAALAGYVYFTSLYLQLVLRFSALRTGLALVPATVTVMAVSALLTRRLLARIGTRPTLLLGLVLIAAGQLWLSSAAEHDSYRSVVLPGILLTSTGLGTAFPAALVAVTAGVGGRTRGLAGGLFATAQQLGAAVGLASLATIAASRTHAAHGSAVAGYRLSFLVAGVLAMAAAGTVIAHSPRLTARTAAVPPAPPAP